MRVYKTAPHFDDHQFFAFRTRAVGVRYMGLDRWDSTNISFDDYKSMGREEHKLFASRDHAAVPSFALNASEMKILVARYFELRANMRFPKVGTPEWRLKMALRKIQKDIPGKRETLRELNYEYVMLKRQGTDPERLQKLEVNIRSLDGEIRMDLRGEAPVVALIYFHFRLGYSSSQSASELGIFPQNVRQIAFRLTKLWGRMQSGQDFQPKKTEIRNAQVREYRKNFTPEQRAAFKKYQADYRKANKETLYEDCKRWRKENPEATRAIARKGTARWMKNRRLKMGAGVPTVPSETASENARMDEPELANPKLTAEV
jgi:hypothetical protein